MTRPSSLSPKPDAAPETICDTDALMYCSPRPWTMMDSMFRMPGYASTERSRQVLVLSGTAAFARSSCMQHHMMAPSNASSMCPCTRGARGC